MVPETLCVLGCPQAIHHAAATKTPYLQFMGREHSRRGRRVQFRLTRAATACTIATLMTGDALLWTVFGGLVLVMLALDLGVFHRREHESKFKEAASWS